MCWIAGLVGKKRVPPKEAMDRMLNCIRHRGPDGEGQWAEGTLILGHRRLAILDLTEDGNQPMLYADRYVLVFNGEIYNYKELRSQLEEKGYVFHTRTDSEVIPAAYDYWGPACQQKMNGMWAFALYDRKKRKIFCSRDRFGIKPFYYCESGEGLAFGSEIKQLLAVEQNRPKANRKILEIFLAVGYRDFSQETMFEGVLQLQGGHYFTYDLSTHCMQLERWFDLAATSEKPMDFQCATERFRKLFYGSINRHLRSDVEVGSCLSGGLDSSAIVCAVNAKLREQAGTVRQRTVSSCFDDLRYDERQYIEAVVNCCPGVQAEKVFPQMEQLMPSLHSMVWHMDEPFASTSIFAQWNVFQAAHELGLKVMLDGQGADEQLAGYTDFYKTLFAWLFRHGHWGILGKEVSAYFRLRAKSERKSQYRFLAVTLVESILPLWVQESLFRIYHANSPEHKWLHLSSHTMDELCAVKRRFAKRDPNAFIRANMEIGMSELLHYEDRNAMAFSVEARVPFLDAELVQGLLEMPFQYKIHEGKTKWVMREALQDLLPDKIQKRYDKMGFVTSEFSWFAEHHDELEEQVRRAAQRLAPVIDAEKLMDWYHTSEAKQMGDLRIWRVLCAAEWARTFQVDI